MKGTKTGGRTKGTPNLATQKQRKAMQASGLSPLDYLLSVMRDESLNTDERVDAAAKAAPYVHPKLSAVTIKGEMSVRRIERVIIDPKAPDTPTRTIGHGDSAQNRLQ